MRKKPLFVTILILCFLNSSASLAQFDELLPVRFSLFTANYALLNPSLIPMQHARSFIMGTQLAAGGFENVYSFYVNGALTLFPDSRSSQRLGVSFVGDSEGELIARNWFKLMYAIEIPISEQVKIGAGTHAGFMSYLVKSTNLSAGGSDIVPVLSVGVKIRSEKGHLGIAINQANQATVIPIEQPIRLTRHINLTADYALQMSSAFILTPALWIRRAGSTIDQYTSSLEATLNDRFSFQTLWFYERNLSFSIGIKNISFINTNLTMRFSYTIPVGTEVFDQFELYEAHFSLNDF